MARSDLAKRFNIKKIWEPYIQERAGRAFFEPRTAWPAPTYEYWWPFPFPAPEVPGLGTLPPDIQPGLVKASEGALQPGGPGQPRPDPSRGGGKPSGVPGLQEALLGLGGALAANEIQRLISPGAGAVLPSPEEIAAAEAGAGLTGPPAMPTPEEIAAAEAGAGMMGPPVLPTAEELAAAEAGAGLMGPQEVPNLFPPPTVEEIAVAEAGSGLMGPPVLPTIEEIMAVEAGAGMTGPPEVPSLVPPPTERVPAITPEEVFGAPIPIAPTPGPDLLAEIGRGGTSPSDVFTPDVTGAPPVQAAPIAQGRFPGDPAVGMSAAVPDVLASTGAGRAPVPQFVDEAQAAQFGEAAGVADVFGQEGELLTGAPYSGAASSAPASAVPLSDPGAIAGSASAGQGVVGPALEFLPPPAGPISDIPAAALFAPAEEAPASALAAGLSPALEEVPSLVPPWLSQAGKALSIPIPGTPFPLIPAVGAALDIASLPGREDLPDVAKGIRGGISAGGVLAAPATGGASLLFAAVPALMDLFSAMGERRPSPQRRWEHEQAGVRESFAGAMSRAESPEDIADIVNLYAGRAYTPKEVTDPERFLRPELGGSMFDAAAGGSGGNVAAYSVFDALRRLAPATAQPGIRETAIGYGRPDPSAKIAEARQRAEEAGELQLFNPATVPAPRGRYQDIWENLERLPAMQFPHVEGTSTEPLFNIWKRAGAPGFDLSYGQWMEDRAQRNQQAFPVM